MSAPELSPYPPCLYPDMETSVRPEELQPGTVLDIHVFVPAFRRNNRDVVIVEPADSFVARAKPESIPVHVPTRLTTVIQAGDHEAETYSGTVVNDFAFRMNLGDPTYSSEISLFGSPITGDFQRVAISPNEDGLFVTDAVAIALKERVNIHQPLTPETANRLRALRTAIDKTAKAHGTRSHSAPDSYQQRLYEVELLDIKPAHLTLTAEDTGTFLSLFKIAQQTLIDIQDAVHATHWTQHFPEFELDASCIARDVVRVWQRQ